jgi:N-acetylneuraminate synthase
MTQNSIKTNSINVIAEIGCNHKGDLKVAKAMISVASKLCGANIAKFQKRCNKELLTENQYNEPHPAPENSYGKTYGKHRDFLEFSVAEHQELKNYCEQIGIKYSTSVWDMTSAKEIASLNPELIKIPSAINLNFELQTWLCKNYGGQIHVSTGMTSKKEIDSIICLYENNHRAKDLVLYACTSGYPVAFEDICLKEISRLRDLYGQRVKAIGFSGHHLGIAADVAAIALGAEWIERHFTLDRTWKGTDHSASLEPDGFRRLVRDLKNVKEALNFKKEDILPVEQEQRKKLKWTNK